MALMKMVKASLISALAILSRKLSTVNLGENMKVFASKSKSILLVLILAFTTGLFFLFNPTERIAAESDMAGRIAYVDCYFNYHREKAKAEIELKQLAGSMQAELEEFTRPAKKRTTGITGAISEQAYPAGKRIGPEYHRNY